ncbi:hypothetical protein STEG23_001525 [Scotinomys teguina]
MPSECEVHRPVQKGAKYVNDDWSLEPKSPFLLDRSQVIVSSPTPGYGLMERPCLLSHRTQDQQPRDGITHNALDPPPLITK